MDFDRIRPTHQDFWQLSGIIIDADTEVKVDEDFVYKSLAQFIDSYSVTYVATQRAFRAAEIVTREDLVKRQKEASRYAATWLEGFYVGAKYQQTKS